MTGADLPQFECEWVRAHEVRPCGALATWSITMHDFSHENDSAAPDPNSIRVWLMCRDCALAVLQWAQREHAHDAGTWCNGCGAMISPTLGAFVIASADLTNSANDIRYDRP